MKANILFTLMFLSLSVFSQQTYIIKYSKKITTQRKQLSPEMMHAYERLRIFELKYINGKSKYSVLYSMIDDVKDETDIYINKSSVCYKDLTKGYYIMIGDYIGKSRAIREHFEDIYDWTISKQNKIIAGYKCQKAQTSYNNYTITAWFTEEIPIIDGPSRVCGLPGLILRTETKFGITEVIDIQVIQNSNETIKIPTKETYLSFPEYLKDRKSRQK